MDDPNYYTKAGEWGERSSIAQTKGSMSAYRADKDFNNGLENMAQAVQADSQIKAFQQLKNIEEAKQQKLLDSKGNLSPLGETAYGIPIAENTAKIATKAGVFGNQELANNLVNTLKENLVAHRMTDKKESREEAERNVNAAMKVAGLDNIKDGEDVARALSRMGAMNYASANTLNIDGASVNLGIDADGNVRVGNIDSSTTSKSGHNQDIGARWANARTLAESTPGYDNMTKEQQHARISEYARTADLTNDAITNAPGNIVALLSDLTGISPEFITNAVTGVLGYKIADKLSGGMLSKGKDAVFNSWKKSSVDDSMPNKSSNPSSQVNDRNGNNTVHNESNNSSHRNPPNKFVSDGRGRVIPNPEYEAYQRNRPILTKISDAVKGGVRSVWNSVKSGRISAVSLASSLALQHTEAGTVLDRADTLNYAAIGGTVGSVVPVVGTAIGAGIGGAIGFAKDVYDGDVKAVWNWARGNTPATNENISSKANAYTVQGSVHNVFANNAQESISYNSKEQASYSRDILSSIESNEETMYKFFDKLNETTKR